MRMRQRTTKSQLLSGQPRIVAGRWPLESPAPPWPAAVADATEADAAPGAVDLNDRDPLFDEAARLIVVHQQGSTSLIQRKFSIGYNRAGRLMDQLEAAGIVGATQGSKPRDVFIADEYSLEKLLSSLH